jgi:Zinc dependent phospholipase C
VFKACSISALLIAFTATQSGAYSVLAHEAIIDATWKDTIELVLLRRFPCATEEELLQAHAYAYGGAIIQDLGYYPFGNELFSDLTHYVRSGDFVAALIRESNNLDEYAFALGALSHYVADNSGHLLATNRAVALMYPKLAKKYGVLIPYEEEPSAHRKVEFGFDVDQVAKGHYAPHAYHEFIGFKVAKPVLERAFVTTYGLEMSSVFFQVDLALGSYRHGVSSVIPSMTKVAWHLKKDEIRHSDPSETKSQFLYHISESEYRKEWGHLYEQPGFFTRLKALALRVMPKVGPLSSLAFHPPTPTTEQLYMNSFNQTVDIFRALLAADREGHLQLVDRNLDTGTTTLGATYRLTDRTYARLVDQANGKPVPQELRNDILAYYADLDRPFDTKRNAKQWRKLLQELDVLKSSVTDQSSDSLSVFKPATLCP